MLTIHVWELASLAYIEGDMVKQIIWMNEPTYKVGTTKIYKHNLKKLQWEEWKFIVNLLINRDPYFMVYD